MSSRPTLSVLVIPHEDGRLTLAAPGPGRISLASRSGESLVPGSRIGLLDRDEKTYELVMPDQGSGIVTSVALEEPWEACEHGRPLMTLGRSADAAAERVSIPEKPPVATDSADSRLFELTAPTHGTFYRRPTPGDPAYVEIGARVEAGQTLGLVEVMKFFSPISFQPPAGSSEGVVREIGADDGDEVRGGQVLFRIELR